MNSLGISVYTGMEQSLADNLAYLGLARRYGYDRLFTSLHIPEADSSGFVQDSKKLLGRAAELGYRVTADISPRTWQSLRLQPEELKAFGISALRADWGFSPGELCDLIRRSGLRLELNASTVDEACLTELFSAGMNGEELCAGHNYYPRPETGLSYELFCRRSRCFSRKSVPVSAFIPGKTCLRGPIFAGLPTLESHRRMSAVEAARQLWASGCVQTILFGDPLIPEAELAAVAALPSATPNVLTLQVEAIVPIKYGSAAVSLPCHTNRIDAAIQVVRSQESRQANLGEVWPQESFRPRRRGDVTVDNSRYGRYAGELQIVLQDLPGDARVNIVGRVNAEDLCLLDCLEPGRKFCLREAGA